MHPSAFSRRFSGRILTATLTLAESLSEADPPAAAALERAVDELEGVVEVIFFFGFDEEEEEEEQLELRSDDEEEE